MSQGHVKYWYERPICYANVKDLVHKDAYANARKKDKSSITFLQAMKIIVSFSITVYVTFSKLQVQSTILTSSTRPNPPMPRVAMTSRSLSCSFAYSWSGLSLTGDRRTSDGDPPLVLQEQIHGFLCLILGIFMHTPYAMWCI